jgi:hypothetical protein
VDLNRPARREHDTVTDHDQPGDAGAPDPGNAPPEQWAEPLADDELADVLARVGNITDPVELAVLAGTEYDPDNGADDEQHGDQEVNPDGGTTA